VKLTRHDLQGVMEGDLDEFTAALAAEERRHKLEAQAA
jgi:protein subunit release factor A